jgi:hypothetical protein
MPSVQFAAWHSPALQTRPRQSSRVLQALPSEQGEQAPPQSMSVSLPLRTWSEHDAVRQKEPTQDEDAQSVATVQAAPVEHGAQVPPQSMSDSVPFTFPSEQEGAWQTCSVQTPVLQSVPAWQVDPSGHGGQSDPPQSRSDSPGSSSALAQVGSVQMPTAQCCVTQSPSLTH